MKIEKLESRRLSLSKRSSETITSSPLQSPVLKKQLTLKSTNSRIRKHSGRLSPEEDNLDEKLQKIDDKLRHSMEIVRKLKQSKSQAYSEDTKILHAHDISRKSYASLMEGRMKKLIDKYSHRSPGHKVRPQRELFFEKEERLIQLRSDVSLDLKRKSRKLLNDLKKKEKRAEENLLHIDEERRKYYEEQEPKKRRFVEKHNEIIGNELKFKQSVISKHEGIAQSVLERSEKKRLLTELARENSYHIRNKMLSLLKYDG